MEQGSEGGNYGLQGETMCPVAFASRQRAKAIA